MSMLSRVAERLYWMARYLERTEMTARLCIAYSQLILDIPKGSALSWETLITTVDAEEAFSNRYKVRSERNILKFLIADNDNGSSIRYAVKAARENVRTTRDVLPEELWEMTNELNLFVEEFAEQSLIRKNRFDFLDEVIARCQQITGLIESATSRDHAYNFLRIGRLIERADMTSRTIDTALSTIMNHESGEHPDFTLVWGGLLNAVSARSAYRRATGPLIEGNEVVAFLLRSRVFPRSILYCLIGINDETNKLKKNNDAAAVLDEIISLTIGLNVEKTSIKGGRQFIDKLQRKIMVLNNSIHEGWFFPETTE